MHCYLYAGLPEAGFKVACSHPACWYPIGTGQEGTLPLSHFFYQYLLHFLLTKYSRKSSLCMKTKASNRKFNLWRFLKQLYYHCFPNSLTGMCFRWRDRSCIKHLKHTQKWLNILLPNATDNHTIFILYELWEPQIFRYEGISQKIIPKLFRGKKIIQFTSQKYSQVWRTFSHPSLVWRLRILEREHRY